MRRVRIALTLRGTRRLLGASAICVAALIPAVAPAAAGGSVSYSLDGATMVSGAPKPYRLEIHAQGGSFASLQLWFSRRATTGNHVLQEHQYFIDETQLGCDAKLKACHLKDAGSLGTLGQIALDFSPTAKPKSHDDLCQDGATSLGTFKTRKGVLRGTFRLVTGTDFFGTIRNKGAGVRVPAAIPITATRYVSSGNDCPEGPPVPCVSGVGVLDFGSSKFAVASKSSADPSASFQVTWQPSTVEPKVDLSHTIFGYVPKSNIKILLDTPDPLQKIAVTFSSLAPFVHGDATFFGTDPPETQTDPCDSIQRSGTLDMDLKVHFDGWGPITFGAAEAIAQQSFAT